MKIIIYNFISCGYIISYMYIYNIIYNLSKTYTLYIISNFKLNFEPFQALLPIIF